MMKPILLMPILLLPAALLWSATHNTELTREVAISKAKAFLSVFDSTEKFVCNYEEAAEGSPQGWVLGLKGTKTSYMLVVRGASGYVTMAASGERDVLRHKGDKRTGLKAFASAADAKSYVGTLAGKIRGSVAVDLVDFRYTEDTSMGNGRVSAGSIRAHYGARANGYPFLSRRFGFSIELDPQDRTLIQYVSRIDLPSIRPAPAKPITLEMATLTAYNKPTSALPDLKGKLGYHLPRGASEAVLCWELNPFKAGFRGMKQIVYVDAERNVIFDKAIIR